MANLSREQIAFLAKGVGWKGSDVNIAVAVALAESGGNPRAHNATPPDNSYGLWQINMLGAMGPDRRKKFGLQSNEDLFQPAVNARAAYGIWKGSGWKAWTTYTRGTYKQYMAGDLSAPETGGSEPPVASTDDSIGGKIQSGLNAVGANVVKSVANIGGIVGAAVLLVLGVLVLARNVVPVGKAFKAVKKL